MFAHTSAELHPYGPAVRPIPGWGAAPPLPCRACHGTGATAPLPGAQSLSECEPSPVWWRDGTRDPFKSRPPALSGDGVTGWRRTLRNCHCSSPNGVRSAGEPQCYACTRVDRGEDAVPWYHLAFDLPAGERRKVGVSQPYDVPREVSSGRPVSRATPCRSSVRWNTPSDARAPLSGRGDVDGLRPLRERLASVEARCEALERHRYAPASAPGSAAKESKARGEVSESEPHAAEEPEPSQPMTLDRLMRAVRRARERAQQYETASREHSHTMS